MLPAAVLALPTPAREEADLELVRRAAVSFGVATVQCLRDYYRMPLLKDARAAIETLIETGELQPVSIEGWSRPAYLHRDAAGAAPGGGAGAALAVRPGAVGADADRAALRLPLPHRDLRASRPSGCYGYYVLPFLLGDRIVARVDLKSDRPAGRLLVRSAWAEDHAPEETVEELAEELRDLAGWLGLSGIVVEPRGDLAPALDAAVRQV